MQGHTKPRAATALFAIVALSAVLAGCGSTPLPSTASLAQPARDTAPPPRQAAPVAESAVAAVTTPPQAPADLPEDEQLARARSVYFGFDEFSVTREQALLIERHGRWLAAHPLLAVRVEGHTDERGGTEYNLALGQKRAEAVRRALAIQGVAVARIEAVSWGESKPRTAGSTEEAWAQNRRADLNYPMQAGAGAAAAAPPKASAASAAERQRP